MNNNELILKELEEISPAVANLDRRNVYSVPSGYFSTLPDHILSFVKERSADVILTSSTTPFKVPEGYFDNLSTQILGKIKQHHIEENDVVKELAEIAPFLNTISRNTPYTIPSGYFDQLTINREEYKTKVVPIRKARRFVQYAAAAAITGLLAMGGVFYLNNDEGKSTAEVANFKTEDLKNLSDQEIVEYLEANATTGVVSSNSLEKDSKLKDTKELTEEEIINFLQENPEPGDAYQVES